MEFVSKGCHRPKPPVKPCPQLPGTVLRIYIPAGAVINLLNLIEVTSPSGICLIIRLPFLGSNSSVKSLYDNIVGTVEAAGGKVEVVD
ncbi:hypothetical protein RH915_03295 [Serpentinicella sp. ANB-PHB4]|uniref:hypothetical protein n=1 Tax=Serpentinicella sp. ANB-PHB4 TaxID=3074076 RepID=UPI00285D3DD4|nr:hypothetical protein [Serpentinicella sp. ANB-PHB4]MDR5658508.1 hypothetical protein [Serpentinicella sp. ANB-PHB4]